MANSDAFSDRLLPGEHLIWDGAPASGLIFTARDLFLIPFSMVWLGFVVFWIWGVLSSGGGLFALFGVAFLAVGLFFMVGRFAIDAWLRGGTRYGLTERRILILRKRPSVEFTSIELDQLPQIRITERPNGAGTIRFGPPASLFAFGGSGMSVWLPSMDPTPQFLAIREARRVFELIQRRAQRQT